MAEKPIVVGYGELMYDEMYDERGNIIAQGGGGCTWNILYNLAMFKGERIYAVGNCGNDEKGRLAVQELRDRGINADSIRVDDKPTNTICATVPDVIDGDNDIRFSLQSPITGQTSYEVSEDLCVEMPPELEDVDKLIIVDRLRRYNLDFIKRTKNKKTALDLGKGLQKPLEELDADFILDFLRHVDILQLNGNVVSIILNKLGISTLQELYQLLNLDLLVVTNGTKCAKFLFEQDDSVEELHMLPEKAEQVANSMGAGNAFFAIVLKGYSEYLSQNKRIDPAFIDTVFKRGNRLAGIVVSQMETRYKGSLTNAQLSGEMNGQGLGEEDGEVFL